MILVPHDRPSAGIRFSRRVLCEDTSRDHKHIPTDAGLVFDCLKSQEAACSPNDPSNSPASQVFTKPTN
jgi:hypothetical protein